ncbi:uncharacterized protein LOC135835727 isoform X2 [Planococcus citri]|uniref:uncharacterized protein LOC135835727 isoform X2 n=1 Tax=Planococcus citri TaxID=170843 RepID=UPI0031F9F2EC
MSVSALAVFVILNGMHKYVPDDSSVSNGTVGQPTYTIMCFKRLVTGRRLIDRYIRRTFPCDSLARCQLACTIEREFICEGFNYRFATSPEIGSSCQLTAMPGMNLDLTLDFISDRDYDFYSRDRNAPATCGQLTYATWNYGAGGGGGGYGGGYGGGGGGAGVGAGGGGGYDRRPNVGADGWWYKPRDPWLPDGVYGVRVQPRVDPLPPPPDTYTPRWNTGHECFVRARTGFRLHRQAIVMTLNAATLYDCEVVCANEKKFMCNIISYRYSSVPSTDNCQLGEKSYRQLDIYFDLVPDRDYDVYVRNEYSRPNCQPTRTWDSDCFERIRTGLRLDTSMVRFAVNTDSLVDCELICLHIRHFTCRAFSYRYGVPKGSSEYNCLLTDIPVPEMDPRRHFIEDRDCEVYHRGSYGHGCEIDRWPYSGYPTSSYIPTNKKDWLPEVPLMPPVRPTIVTITTTSLRPPYDQPSTPRPGSDVPGHSFFTPTGKPYLPPDYGYPGHNNKGTYKPPTYLPPPKDKPQPVWPVTGYDVQSSSRKMDKLCYIPYGSPARLSAASVGNSVLVVNELECKAECSRSRDQTHFKCATISYWSGHCELSDIELRDLRPGQDFTQHDSYWLFSWDFTNPRCFVPTYKPPSGSPTKPSSGGGIWPSSGGGVWPTSGGGVWSSYTVTGRPCKWGTKCAHRADAGIWSCPVEDGDWDYCCRPDHHCGYSEGYSYPWCYVGSVSREQWRPCSESYRPYQEHKRKAPHWPISYVHKQGPPNNTARHQPSLVDNFLESLHFEKDRILLNSSGSSAPYSTVTPLSKDTNTSSLLEFQIVDVSETPKNDSDSSVISEKTNNITALSNQFSSVKRMHSQTTEHTKEKKNVKRSTSIT